MVTGRKVAKASESGSTAPNSVHGDLASFSPYSGIALCLSCLKVFFKHFHYILFYFREEVTN